MGWVAFLSHPQPLVYGIRKSQDSTLHNILQLEAMLLFLNDSEISFWIEISFIFTDNLLVVAYMNSKGGIHSQVICSLICRIMVVRMPE